MKNNPTTIIIHCTDYSYRNLADQRIECEGWHRDRGFPVSSLGSFVGYQVLITGGKNYQCRLDTDQGAHCNQHENGVSMNFQSLGICCGFDGDIEYPTPEDYTLLQKQIWAWQDKYNIPSSRVRFHRYYAKDKTCPGSLITDQWLKDLLTRPKPPEVTVKVLCTDPEIVKKANMWQNLLNFIKANQ